MKFIISTIILIFAFTPFQVIAELSEQSNNEAIILELREANLRLEEQNKMLKSSSSELKNSYYAALSFSATFLVLFLGINVYFFRSRYSEDKNYLQQHLDVNVDSKMNLVNDAFKALEGQLESAIKEHVDVAVAKHTAPLKSQVSSLQSSNRYNSVEIKLLNIKLEKIPSNKIRLLLSVAKDYKLLNWDYQLSETLVEIKDLLKEGATFDSSDLPDIERFLNSLSSEYTTTISQIRTQLK
ncbi:hypothetical protein [Vibrio vulnificus]|uniref:hypothetical protein n=1 Tax=Vibrio vulnificus TaxID=672 RepID=UPI00287A2BCA|nr:hypothetical protein [Vibrio vulnificus]MDS1780660.1 hypothetical protein [Vibrio vulnificus]MDS1807953.1 hypothetical protein [Vibrio vulnificus]